MRARGYVLIAIAACSWGTWPLILRHVAMSPALEAAVALLVMTLASVPVMLRDRSPVAVRRGRTGADWLGIAWLGVGDAANVGLFFAAYQRTTVAVAVLTHYLTPIFVALAAPIVLGERARGRTFVAALVAFGGLVLLLEPWRGARGAEDFAGAALGAGSAVFYASNVLLDKRLARAFTGAELMFFHGLVATPILFALAALSKAGLAAPASSWAVVAAGALGPGAAAGLFFVWGIRGVPATHASVLTLLEPLVAVVSAAALLGERAGLLTIAGGAIILAAAAAVVAEPANRPARDQVDSGP